MSNNYIRKMCYDRILPRDLRARRKPQFVVLDGPHGKVRALMPIGKAWPNGTTLNIRFLGGSADQRKFVEEKSIEWTKLANLEFKFNNSPTAEIRIAFEDDGAWSYLGVDNLEIPMQAATMNFGWLEEGTVLHEFGHALGLAHEHQNPAGGIQWNREVVLRELQGPPNRWTPAMIEHNVFSKYEFDQINGTVFDPESIMLYAFPPEWTLNGVGTDENEVLSESDRRFIASVYPREAAPEIVTLPVIEAIRTAAAIGAPGEEDLFSFNAGTAGSYSVQTFGNTDLVMKLFGPDSRAALVDEDDDSGESRNALIRAELAPGQYFVQVRHYSKQSGTGDYRIAVTKDE